MVIENRDAVVAGVKLTGTHKKQQYVCTVETGENGKLVFIYGGKNYSSPSSAGTAIIGTACNGWRFWSIEGENTPLTPAPAIKKTTAGATTATPTRPKAPTRTAKPRKVIYKNPNQAQVAQGHVRWFCTACMKGFVVEGAEPQEACPEGHRNDDPELSTPTTTEEIPSS